MARRLPAWTPVVAIFSVLLGWSAHAYLTVRFNSDILVEAIAVQNLLQDLSWVLSYPGQLHGGVVEYPIMALGELLAPGNPYGFTFIRISYVPITGVLLALSLRRAFPAVNLWWFAAAAAAGPALLHDFRAISDIYPFGWLLSAIGVYLIAGKRFLLLGGVLLGLGVYEHATAALMSLPLVFALAVRFGFPIRSYIRIAIGGVIGLIPMALAQFTQADKVVVWAPAEPGLPRAADMLGLSDGGAAWPTSMLPGAWGIQDGGTTFLGVSNSVQFFLNLALILGLLLFLVLGSINFVRGQARWSDPLGFLIVMWASGLVLALLLSAVVPTVWFYGLSLGFLVWVTVALAPKPLSLAIVATMAVMSLYSVDLFTNVGANISSKWEDNQVISGVAQSLVDNNVIVIFGDYWEVLPVAYASAGKVSGVTANFNRLPLPDSVVNSPEIIVGVASGRIALPEGRDRWDSSAAVEELVKSSCRYVSPLPGDYSDLVDLYRCPSNVVVEGIG